MSWSTCPKLFPSGAASKDRLAACISNDCFGPRVTKGTLAARVPLMRSAQPAAHPMTGTLVLSSAGSARLWLGSVGFGSNWGLSRAEPFRKWLKPHRAQLSSAKPLAHPHAQQSALLARAHSLVHNFTLETTLDTDELFWWKKGEKGMLVGCDRPRAHGVCPAAKKRFCGAPRASSARTHQRHLNRGGPHEGEQRLTRVDKLKAARVCGPRNDVERTGTGGMRAPEDDIVEGEEWHFVFLRCVQLGVQQTRTQAAAGQGAAGPGTVEDNACEVGGSAEKSREGRERRVHGREESKLEHAQARGILQLAKRMA
ncbi:hypothetical protein GGX14DRAFT_606468, partial [Mycena pura]